jgi:hypothetical protein
MESFGYFMYNQENCSTVGSKPKYLKAKIIVKSLGARKPKGLPNCRYTCTIYIDKDNLVYECHEQRMFE